MSCPVLMPSTPCIKTWLPDIVLVSGASTFVSFHGTVSAFLLTLSQFRFSVWLRLRRPRMSAVRTSSNFWNRACVSHFHTVCQRSSRSLLPRDLQPSRKTGTAKKRYFLYFRVLCLHNLFFLVTGFLSYYVCTLPQFKKRDTCCMLFSNCNPLYTEFACHLCSYDMKIWLYFF